MTMKGTVNIVVSAGGKTIQSQFSREAVGGLPPQELALEKAQGYGTLSTRTTDTSGTLTLQAGHGITDGKIIDIYWVDTNGKRKCAYGAIVGTVSVNDVPFTVASGPVLPEAATEITCDIVEVLDVDFDADKCPLLAAQMKTAYGHVVFEDVGDVALDVAMLLPNEGYLYWEDADCFPTNPLGGNPIDEIHVSNGDKVNGGTFELCGLHKSNT